MNANVHVLRNDHLTVKDSIAQKPDYIVVGPGPGTPQGAGISKSLIDACAGKIPVLGICLGMQAIAEVFGGAVIRAQTPMHGKTSNIHHSNEGVFTGLPNPFLATRYHSLVVDRQQLPLCLKVTAKTVEGEIMGLRHREFPIEGVQFHPESILCRDGYKLLSNFLESYNVKASPR